MTHTLHLGDSEGVLQFYQDNTFDSIVTDPPYGINFMNRGWDYNLPSINIWKECLRVLKPGGHILAFSSARTYHRLVVNIEDAGFEIRDQIMWVYGSGFPKNHNVGKSVQKIDTDNNDWNGWGTGLKPAHEPIVLARKPLSEKTIALNVLKWGTGAINVDKSRVEGGRFPANFIHDGSQQVLDLFPQTTNGYIAEHHKRSSDDDGFLKELHTDPPMSSTYGDKGSASRYFYCAKASKKERNAGCETLPDKEWKHHKCSNVAEDGIHNANGKGTVAGVSKNNHPTVKPQALMTYLINLITPPG